MHTVLLEAACEGGVYLSPGKRGGCRAREGPRLLQGTGQGGEGPSRVPGSFALLRRYPETPNQGGQQGLNSGLCPRPGEHLFLPPRGGANGGATP